MLEECICDPQYRDGRRFVPWVGQYFGDCIYSTRQEIAVWSGLLSLVLVGVALVPQLWKNYRQKSVQGLSLMLFVSWMLGDLANLAGAILTVQFPTQQLSGLYFLVTDVVVVMQCLYYEYAFMRWQKIRDIARDLRRNRETVDDAIQTERNPPGVVEGDLAEASSHTSFGPGARHVSLAVMVISFLAGKSFAVMMTQNEAELEGHAGDMLVERAIDSELPLCNSSPHITSLMYWMGVAMAWASGILYFLSRLPQLIENYHAKSVKGISLWLILLTLCSNFAYGISILARYDELSLEKLLESTLPYLIGSIGTFVFDIAIFYQAFIYRNNTVLEIAVSPVGDPDAGSETCHSRSYGTVVETCIPNASDGAHAPLLIRG